MADRSEDFEIGPDGKLRRKDSAQPRLLGDRFNRNQDGSLRWDGGLTNPSRAGSLLSNAKSLLASGMVLDGASPVVACREAKANMSNDLREQQNRKPVFESDLVRAAMGLPTSTPDATAPEDEPINMLFPEGPKRGDGGAETSRAKARREQRTPAFDSDTVRNGAPTSTHEDSCTVRERATTAARTPHWDNDATRSV